MDWYKIITTVLIVIFGYFVSYLKTKNNLLDEAKNAVNYAEKEYEDTMNAGSEKMSWAIDYLYGLVPTIIKPLITKDVLQSIIQTVFDGMKMFADYQLDKIIDKNTD